MEVLIFFAIPALPNNPITPTATTYVNNAVIDGSNLAAAIGNLLQAIYNIFADHPLNFIQIAEGAIEQMGSGGTVSANPLSSLLAAIPSAWLQALPFGLTKLGALITNSSLVLRFEHPQDPAPIIFNTAALPNLFSSGIATVAECNAGTTITVTGSNFPVVCNGSPFADGGNIFPLFSRLFNGNVWARVSSCLHFPCYLQALRTRLHRPGPPTVQSARRFAADRMAVAPQATDPA